MNGVTLFIVTQPVTKQAGNMTIPDSGQLHFHIQRKTKLSHKLFVQIEKTLKDMWRKVTLMWSTLPGLSGWIYGTCMCDLSQFRTGLGETNI